MNHEVHEDKNLKDWATTAHDHAEMISGSIVRRQYPNEDQIVHPSGGLVERTCRDTLHELVSHRFEQVLF